MQNVPASTSSTSTSSSLYSIDKLTISYLKGEMSFQQYESLLENQHLQADTVRCRLNETNVASAATLSNSGEKSPSSGGGGGGGGDADGSKRKRSSNSSSSSSASTLVKDRFLNLKNSLGEDIQVIRDDDDEDDDDDEGSMIG